MNTGNQQISGTWDRSGSFAAGGELFEDGHLRISAGPGIAVHREKGRLLAVDGQIFDVPSAELLRDPVRLDGAFGYFAYVLYDAVSRALTIGTDRFGYFPMYYAQEGESFHFGSSMNDVRTKLKRRSPDYEAWEELLVLGEVIGEKSTVKQIKRLAPGTRIEIRDDRIRLVVHWSPEVPEPMPESDYLSENNRLLCEAMSLTATNPLRKVVLLSGGEDSRRLALAAVTSGLEVDFFTQESVYRGNYSVGVDRDILVARSVAQYLGRPHFSEPMPDDEQFLRFWLTRDRQLGFECISHEWLLPLARRIEPGALIYDGIVGDVTVNGHYFKAFPRAVDEYSNLDALAQMICGPDQPQWLKTLRTKVDTPLADRVKALLNTYPDSPHRLTYFYILNHTRRKISCASQLFRMHGHDSCYPYLYYPLFLQSLRIDCRRLVTRFYQRECMMQMDPGVLQTPTTREKLPDSWVVVKSKKETEQSDCLLRNLEISERALEVFPAFRRRYSALRATRGLGMVPLRRFGWFIPSIARFSAFLDWVDE